MNQVVEVKACVDCPCIEAPFWAEKESWTCNASSEYEDQEEEVQVDTEGKGVPANCPLRRRPLLITVK